jgi:hypothetical protein
LIEGNTVRACGVYNILVENHNNATVRGNTCIESVRANIVIGTINGCTVEGNKLINTATNTDAGITGQDAILLINAATGVVVGPNEYINDTDYATAKGPHRARDDSSGANIIRKAPVSTGVATIVDGVATNIVVTISAPYTPEARDIYVHPIESLGTASYWWVDSISTTQFVIRINASAGADVDFVWTLMG